MRKRYLLPAALCLIMAGCSSPAGSSDPSPQEIAALESQVEALESQVEARKDQAGASEGLTAAPESQDAIPESQTVSVSPTSPHEQQSAADSSQRQPSSEGIDRDSAFSIALENADVPEEDAANIEIQQDREGDIPIYQVEFETRYGDYDFEIAISDGRIVGADYEVDEEWLGSLGGSPVTEDEACQLAAAKVPGSSAGDVRIRRERDDGRERYEGQLFYDGIKYEFEIDPQSGIVFDWNADLRE